MNELMHLELAAPWLARRARRAPGVVTGLWCRPSRTGGLMFAWQPPAGGGPVEGYRIERTRDGRAYEWLGESVERCFTLPATPWNIGWFYRVSAFNARGQGAARWVWFYLRRREPILQPVPVIPGRRVNICELAAS